MSKKVLRENKNYVFLTIFVLHFALLNLMTICAYSQENEYKITGRIVDENGLPLSGIGVYIYPKPVFGGPITQSFSDNNGYFSVVKEVKKGTILYFYAVRQSPKSIPERDLITPPFDTVINTNENLTGKPFKVEDELNINLGDLQANFWYANVHLKILRNGRKLTDKQWDMLWCRLLDGNGRLIAEQSVGLSNGGVDFVNSIFNVSLPEGKWRIEFQRFDDQKSKIHPKILGRTPYFTINKDTAPELINVTIK